MELKFTIKGNQENPKGNPIPYYRQTQRSSFFNKGAKRYHEWKDYVRDIAFGSTKDHIVITPKVHRLGIAVAIDTSHSNRTSIQLTGERKLYMNLKIYFANKAHADSDNIFKGVADALFDNDKYVAGSFDFDYDKENPRIEVEILDMPSNKM